MAGSELLRRVLEDLGHPHEREKSKPERAIQLIEESHARRLARLGGLSEGRCGFCNGLTFTYRPPALLVWKCRKCSSWNQISDE